MLYIHNELGFYKVDSPLSYNFETGSTLEEYLAGRFILLNNNQLTFLTANPTATSEEILKMILKQPVQPPIGMMKRDKISEIEAYDTSENVNCFFINNTPMWLDRNTRASLYITVAAYKASGIEEITLWTTNSIPSPITLPVVQMENLLTQLELYAKNCYDITAQHKAVIREMIYSAEVSIYDITKGYPDKLSLEL